LSGEPVVTTPSRVPVEARSYELDPYGHVNNGVYVNWLEHGRLSWLRDRGMTYMTIPETWGVHVVVVSLRADYKAQVRLGDRLTVVSRGVRVGRSSFVFAHRVEFEAPEADGTHRVAVEGEVVMVATRAGRSAPLPEGLRARLLAPPDSGIV
jgi:thioesterase-3